MITTMMFGMIPNINASTMKIYPSDDAFVRMQKSSTNYGTIPDLRVGYNTNIGTDRAYLKFDLSSLNGATINSATFSIEPNSYQGSPSIQLYNVPTTSWTEGTLRWSNQPSYTTLIDSKQITSLDRISYDVKNYLTGSDIAFAMVEDGENQFAQFFSKEYYYNGGEEDNARKPYLLVDYSGGTSYSPADLNQDGAVSLSEYTSFKYGYKTGTYPSVTLAQYTSIKYAYKTGQL